MGADIGFAIAESTHTYPTFLRSHALSAFGVPVSFLRPLFGISNRQGNFVFEFNFTVQWRCS